MSSCLHLFVIPSTCTSVYEVAHFTVSFLALLVALVASSLCRIKFLVLVRFLVACVRSCEKAWHVAMETLESVATAQCAEKLEGHSLPSVNAILYPRKLDTVRPRLTAHIRFAQKYPDRRGNRITEHWLCWMHHVCCKSATS